MAKKYYGRCLTTFKDPNYSQGRRKCPGRRMLSMKPSEYLRPPKCPHCGGNKWYLDTNIIRRHKKERCHCGGYSHTHRIGSKFCDHHPDAEKHQAERWEGLGE